MKISTEVKDKLNERARIECRVCKASTQHRLFCSVDIHGDDQPHWEQSFQWHERNQVAQCLGCETVSFRRVSGDSERFPIQVGPDEYVDDETIEVFPNPNSGRECVNDDHLLPKTVNRIYTETLIALNGSQPVLCGIGIRALIETIAQERKAPGDNLYKKINGLVTQGILTQAGADILHKLRVLGNDAAHEVKPHSAQQLGLAMDVVEHLLQGVYILPHHAQQTFD